MPEADYTLTPKERLLVKKLFSDPTLIPEVFKVWMRGQQEVDPAMIPISQIIGFSGFTAKFANDTSSGTRAATTYGAAGPTLSGLADGLYLLIYGAVLYGSILAGGNYAAPEINGAAPDDATAAYNANTDPIGVTAGSLATLDQKVNEIKLKFRSGDAGNTTSFFNRWLIALKYGNP